MFRLVPRASLSPERGRALVPPAPSAVGGAPAAGPPGVPEGTEGVLAPSSLLLEGAGAVSAVEGLGGLSWSRGGRVAAASLLAAPPSGDHSHPPVDTGLGHSCPGPKWPRGVVCPGQPPRGDRGRLTRARPLCLRAPAPHPHARAVQTSVPVWSPQGPLPSGLGRGAGSCGGHPRRPSQPPSCGTNIDNEILAPRSLHADPPQAPFLAQGGEGGSRAGRPPAARLLVAPGSDCAGAARTCRSGRSAAAPRHARRLVTDR